MGDMMNRKEQGPLPTMRPFDFWQSPLGRRVPWNTPMSWEMIEADFDTIDWLAVDDRHEFRIYGGPDA